MRYDCVSGVVLVPLGSPALLRCTVAVGHLLGELFNREPASILFPSCPPDRSLLVACFTCALVNRCPNGRLSLSWRSSVAKLVVYALLFLQLLLLLLPSLLVHLALLLRGLLLRQLAGTELPAGR